MAKTKPLKLDGLANDELLELIVRSFEEGVQRAVNYVDMLEDAPPGELVDVRNEGLAFAVKLSELMPIAFGRNPLSKTWSVMHHALDDLKEQALATV